LHNKNTRMGVQQRKHLKDEESMETVILAFLGTFIFAALLYFVSGMEIAIFSLTEISEQNLTKTRKWLIKSSENPEDIETFFIVAKASFLTLIAICNHFFFEYLILTDNSLLRYIIEGSVFGTIVIFTLTVLPVSAVLWNENKTLRHSSLLFILYVIFYPIKFILKDILNFILLKIGVNGIESLATQRQLAYIADESGAHIEDEERMMIKHIIDFVETTVREVMVPRIDIISSEMDSSASELIELIDEYGHSRIPLYQDTIDNVVGIVYAKDLLLEIGKNSEKIDLSKICRKPYFVPESKLIDELLGEFRKEKLHIAIVVDEFGGVAGLVTMEDLLEEIVGEIQDEYDEEEIDIMQLDENVWQISGKTSIDEVSELLDVELPDQESDTIGGLIYELAGAIPKPGFEAELDSGITLIVTELDGQRIKTVKIIKKEK